MKRSNPWITAALQSILLLSTVAAASPWLEAREASLPTPRRPAAVALAARRPARPIYNGSVVPGGVYSADELRRAMQHDRVVASHYRDAAVAELRPVTLTAGRAAYVSYRVNNQVYWTRQRVWLRAGETVLTDGTTVVRARCGNCVSDAQLGPVAAVDPAHGELDDFVLPPLGERGGDSVAAEAPPGLDDLLELPFGPQMFAAASPELPAIAINRDGPFGGAFGSGGPGGFVPRGSQSDQPVPHAGFVPDDGLTTGGTISGSSGEATTEAASGAVTGSPSGSPDGDMSWATTGTTDARRTTGFPACCTTSGNPFVTTAVATTVAPSPHQHQAPEPAILWLVACGAIGVASRRWRRR